MWNVLGMWIIIYIVTYKLVLIMLLVDTNTKSTDIHSFLADNVPRDQCITNYIILIAFKTALLTNMKSMLLFILSV